MTDDLVRQLHEHGRSLREVCRRLDHNATALDVIGLKDLAEKLFHMSTMLEESFVRLDNAFGQSLSDQLAKNQQSLGQTIQAVLNAATKEINK